MEITQNAVYFETQLNAASAALNDPIIDLLISDMVLYAKQLEAIVPPADNQESKPKPDELQSTVFQQRIDQLGSISPELLSLFNDFNTYIESLENEISD